MQEWFSEESNLPLHFLPEAFYSPLLTDLAAIALRGCLKVQLQDPSNWPIILVFIYYGVIPCDLPPLSERADW
jgi:hypothetical protein